MFGKNEIASPRPPGTDYLVHSSWNTIQGEGPYAGWPAVFVRFAGCNLRCFFCDTDFTGGALYTPFTLSERIGYLSDQMNRAPLVVLTGGEPMLQDIPSLVMSSDLRFRFQIETAGTVWPETVNGVSMEDLILAGRITLVCSPKTPTIHPMVEKHCYDWKYIVRDGEVSLTDGLPVKSTQIEGREMRVYRAKSGVIHVQPMDEPDQTMSDINTQIAVKASMAFGYRLSLQLHKIVGLA
jgi:7-carboxy-7-deazaguanine synthase